MEYTAEITVRATRAITENTLFDLAEIGGVAVGKVGERFIETTLTVKAADVREAGDVAIETVIQRVPGLIVAMEIMTTAEADRRSAERPKLVGVTEVAEILGVSKQRVSTLSRRPDFPLPLERLSTGPVWRAGDLSTFSMGWQRKAGRPRKAPPA